MSESDRASVCVRERQRERERESERERYTFVMYTHTHTHTFSGYTFANIVDTRILYDHTSRCGRGNVLWEVVGEGMCCGRLLRDTCQITDNRSKP